MTGQALKLISANPDAILVVASGSGAAMPHKGLVERGYPKAKIYQTHGAATMDLIRVGGADVEGSFVSSGPAVVADKLPASNASKELGMRYITEFEKANGKGSANQFGAHAYDVVIVLQKAVPIALKKGKPGTKEFRAGLKEAFETMGRTPVSQGVLNWTATDHFGYTPETGVLLKVANGDWQVVPATDWRPPGPQRRFEPQPALSGAPSARSRMDSSIVGILMLDGVTNGAVYALLALAIVLVFAVTRVIFIPQGEFVAYGALTLALLQLGQVPGTVWLLVGLALLAALLDAAQRAAARPAAAAGGRARRSSRSWSRR